MLHNKHKYIIQCRKRNFIRLLHIKCRFHDCLNTVYCLLQAFVPHDLIQTVGALIYHFLLLLLLYKFTCFYQESEYSNNIMTEKHL